MEDGRWGNAGTGRKMGGRKKGKGVGALRRGECGYVFGMNTLETDIEIAADGSMKLLSPLPDWLKPGRAHVVLTVAVGTDSQPKRQISQATPEMIARRMAALEKVRELNPYRDIADSVAWQCSIREDVIQPGRE